MDAFATGAFVMDGFVVDGFVVVASARDEGNG